MSMATLEAQVSAIPDLTFNSAGFAEEPSFGKLGGELVDIVQRIYRQIEGLSLRLLDCSTVDEFVSVREKEFSSYVNLSMALANIALVTLDQSDYANLVQGSLTETEKHFRSKGPLYFGDEAWREILFSISTLKNAQHLIPRLAASKPSNPSEDRALASKFFGSSVWTNIHLHCLRLAMQNQKTVNQEILQTLLDGLRASVMAYSFARAALDLRGFEEARYAEKPASSWDEEDDALAKSD